MKKLIALAAVLVAAAAGFSACGNNNDKAGADGAGGNTPPSNAQDVRFSQDMIVHHEQALTMARIVKQHHTSPELEKLAGAIQAAQGPEIKKMTAWLRAWGKRVPSASMPGMGHGMAGMGGVGNGMPGMLGTKALHHLRQAGGNRFETLWLRGMIGHHRGAIKMASVEQRQGRYPGAIQMAKGIVTAQHAEITKMKRMLGA